MAAAYFTGTDPRMETGPEGLFKLVVETGSEEIEILMSRGNARSMVEFGRRLLNSIDRAEQAAIILKFPPPELRRQGAKRKP